MGSTGRARRALTTIGAAVAAAGALAAPAQGETFGFTGGEQTYVVPPGVTYVDVTAVGARGGDGSQYGVGGSGASISARLPVSPGQTLYVHVGGAGADGVGDGTTAPGGFNGGGRGAHLGGGGGGGASDVRTVPVAAGAAASLASRLLVAAGGGGATDRGNGGDAGGTGTSAPVGYPGLPGGAGTATGGGAGGGTFGGDPGTAGTLGAGGDGGYTGGGGGGGGLYGGGGGGGGVAGDGAGGGGGSSHADPAATNVGGPAVTGVPASVTIEPGPAAAAVVPPSVTAVTPAEGPVAGGTVVTIHGTHFGSASAVLFGDVPASSFAVRGFDRIEAVAPPAARPGEVAVTVRGPGGSGAAGTFAYRADPLPIPPAPAPAPGPSVVTPVEAPCTVPDVTGLGLRAARQALRDAHCTVGEVRRRGHRGPRVVVRQGPRAGQERPAGTAVRLTLRPARRA